MLLIPLLLYCNAFVIYYITFLLDFQQFTYNIRLLYNHEVRVEATYFFELQKRFWFFFYKGKSQKCLDMPMHKIIKYFPFKRR